MHSKLQADERELAGAGFKWGLDELFNESSIALI